MISDPAAFGSSHEEGVRLAEDEWRRRVKNALFAISGGRPVGMVAFVFNERANTRHVVEVFGAYVSCDYRGSGSGSSRKPSRSSGRTAS